MHDFLIPTHIESPRLVLRMLQDADWRALHEQYSDEECTRYTLGRVLTEGESWRTMSTILGHWMLRGYGPYAVTDKQSGDVLGVVGMWYPNDWPEPEILWQIIRRYWGQGYASEATRAVQTIARQHFPELSLISLIDERNTGSIRVAKAVGATFEKELQFRGNVCQVYRHPDVDNINQS